ncbi:hypothetical protein O181_031602 [Austropuccinia psidii MF-1]|uniref:Uncharacterized protein n=1 Tax=Austropuccinia psidii MF-1 TaxID=1389203 RepID=A0A9Q3CXY1_9BASI|nr:hypothetical protein [Austropuccinia psidii MF-1]
MGVHTATPDLKQAPGKLSSQLVATDFMSSRTKLKLTSSKDQENVEHTSHSVLTPNPVTFTNIGSPLPSMVITRHLIILQPAGGCLKLHKTHLFAHIHLQPVLM